MADPEHLTVLKQGVEAWNEWRRANPVIEPDLRAANLCGATLFKANLCEADLHGADLIGATLCQANLNRATLRAADLYRANFRTATLHGATLRRADLREADLREANLRGADLREANLREATLHGANLNRANLNRADLHRADLSGAALREATLTWVNLNRANLYGADLYGADLGAADLHGADLREATLHGASLSGVNLRQVNLYEADFSQAELGGTIFVETNLTEVKGLDTCYYGGPSTLDFRILQQSGPLPLTFLRGCGLPDLLIDYLPSLLNQPIQYYSCFISYSTKDEDFAKRLHADLQDQGVRCWFAPKDIQGGRKIYEQIGEAIRLYEKLLLVLSEHSMNSEWVKTEIAKARQREVREKRQVLFPIRLVDYETIQDWECFDAKIGKDSAVEILEYFIPDFSNWKSHDAYQQSFDRLLRDLKPALERKPETT